jgi:drug/metabolite transporter (DMT)-like permease
VTVLLALGASLAYGVSDFAGAVAARRLRVLPATTLTYALALVTLAVLLPLVGGAWSASVVAWGSAAGVAAVVGFITFYGALAAGPISLAAPLIAVLGSLVPVAVAIAQGEQLPPLAWGAVALAIIGAGLISVVPRGDSPRLRPRTVVLSLVAGATLGLSIVFLDKAPADSGITSAFVEIAVGVVILLALMVLGRAGRWGRRATAVLDPVASPADTGEAAQAAVPAAASNNRRALVLGAAAGVLLGLANAGLVLALLGGSLAVVSVLIGLYPAATILLARVVHGERVTLVQLVGILVAIGASLLLAIA